MEQGFHYMIGPEASSKSTSVLKELTIYKTKFSKGCGTPLLRNVKHYTLEGDGCSHLILLLCEIPFVCGMWRECLSYLEYSRGELGGTLKSIMNTYVAVHDTGKRGGN